MLVTNNQIDNYLVVNQFDQIFSALSDPTRREILARLATRQLTVHELTSAFELTQQAISKHLAVLEKSGLVRRERKGRTTICTAHLQPLTEIVDWAEKYRSRWQKSLNQLESFLETKKKRGKNAKAR